MKVQILVGVFDAWDYGTWSWEEFVKVLDKVPQEYRDTATVRLDGNECGHLSVTYNRPETQEETAQRVAQEENARTKREAYERSEYERLARKYG